MPKDTLTFLPCNKEDIIDIDLTINTKTMVMIRTRINGFEQTINIPLGGSK